MTESRLPPRQGQIDAPNPLELFWEKNKRVLTAALAVAVAVIAGVYGWRYVQQQETNELWSRAMAVANLDEAYAEDSAYAFFLQRVPEDATLQQRQQQQRIFEQYLSLTRMNLLAELREDVEAADPEELRQAVERSAGTPAEPILLWVLAVHDVESGDFDEARAKLDELEARFPEHFLAASSAYPPQVREAIEEEDGEPEEGSNPRAGGTSEAPELEEPEPGSPVALLRHQIEQQERFRQEHSWLYEAPEPAAEPRVVVRLSTDEQLTIGLYPDAAPEHVRNFLTRVHHGFYEGQRIHEVTRQGTAGAQGPAPEQIAFGLPASKQDDRSLWDTNEPSSIQLDFEDNDLSHFPGMVAAASEGEGESSGARVWINANDVATSFDDRRVIFGRIVDGLDVIERIATEPAFTEEAMRRSGRGQLQQNITIESMEIVGEVPEELRGKDWDTPPTEEGTGPETPGQGEPGEDR